MGASKTTKSTKILVLENFRLYGRYGSNNKLAHATPWWQGPYHASEHARRCEDLMAFLFQVSAPGANQPQVQRETIEPLISISNDTMFSS